MTSHYVGIDLGTTNSVCAVFDGNEVTVVRSSLGGYLTPSVVRYTSKGVCMVGQKAQRFLHSDSANTHREFKRLMGTRQKLNFPASQREQFPEQLAAEIIKSLCSDIELQFGYRPKCAIVTVPALFELPQSNATSEAARLAGLEKVELLQEPVASALAAGWSESGGLGSWLVFDLGGGTFDVSLLESREGLLRVVGHDGDNFLGGRDFDRSIVNWILAQIELEHGIQIDRKDAANEEILRRITLAAEEAKIELSSSQQTNVCLEQLSIGDTSIDVDLNLKREVFEQVCQPLLDKTIDICERLLQEKGLSKDQLSRVVLVGGPTMIPFVRQQVSTRLAPIASGGFDPMTLVAQGAALYASTVGLAAESSKELENAPANDIPNKLWLQHPPMCSDLEPHVLGRLVETSGPQPESVQIIDSSGKVVAESGIDKEGFFMVTVMLSPRQTNHFEIKLRGATGYALLVTPEKFSIAHGITISDPPLSRSVGVALANGQVRLFFERGTPLPAKRTFTHKTVETLLNGLKANRITIPIVQGEFDEAHLCRLVGTLELSGADLDAPLAMGTQVDITLELDRGGQLVSSALIPTINKMFTGVAHLVVPQADLKAMSQLLTGLQTRFAALQRRAFRESDAVDLRRLAKLQQWLVEAEQDICNLEGGDQDAGQRARRTLNDIDAALADHEANLKMESLLEEAEDKIFSANYWINSFGSAAEKDMFNQAYDALKKAAKQGRASEVHRQSKRIQQLANTTFARSPNAWQHYFEQAASRVHDAYDLKRANHLVSEGRKLIAAKDESRLKSIVEELWNLLPEEAKEKQKSFYSGIR